MINSGWQNVTSLYSSDGDVLVSTGESGDKSLCINLRSTNASNANDIATTDYNVMSYRLPESYVAGAVGVAGTFGRTTTAEVWKVLYIAPTATTKAKATTVTLYYHCNKNRIIFAVIYPDASGIAPIIHFIGLPDEIYVNTTGSRDVIVASSGGMATGVNLLYISNAVASMPSDTASTQRTVYNVLPPKQLNADNRAILEMCKYGNATEGYRGKITGIYLLGSTTSVVNTGNIITQDSKQYYIINVGALNFNSFGSAYLAIQIA
jgi:hypothetical protein